MPVWRMIYLCTWTPGVKEQDKLNPRRLSEAQAVSANRCIGGRADGQGQRVPGGAGDCSAPAGNVNISRQTKDSPGSILLRGLGTCVEQERTDIYHIRENHLLPGGMEWNEWKHCFFPRPCLNLAMTFLNLMPSMDSTSREFNIGSLKQHKNQFQPRRWTLGPSLISSHTCFSCWKAPPPVKAGVSCIAS